MKEEVKGDSELTAAFHSGDTAAAVVAALDGSERGRRLSRRAWAVPARVRQQGDLVARVRLSHLEGDPAPIIEAVRGYLESDYDFQAELDAVKADLDGALHELMDDVPEGEGRARLQAALDLSLRMNPLTPDHHFFIDQGTNARLRLVLVALGRRLVRELGASTMRRT